jgi:hypothetical protein
MHLWVFPSCLSAALLPGWLLAAVAPDKGYFCGVQGQEAAKKRCRCGVVGCGLGAIGGGVRPARLLGYWLRLGCLLRGPALAPSRMSRAPLHLHYLLFACTSQPQVLAGVPTLARWHGPPTGAPTRRVKRLWPPREGVSAGDRGEWRSKRQVVEEGWRRRRGRSVW